jgi:hypothetical protein
MYAAIFQAAPQDAAGAAAWQSVYADFPSIFACVLRGDA